jgi:hypothetical protein
MHSSYHSCVGYMLSIFHSMWILKYSCIPWNVVFCRYANTQWLGKCLDVGNIKWVRVSMKGGDSWCMRCWHDKAVTVALITLTEIRRILARNPSRRGWHSRYTRLPEFHFRPQKEIFLYSRTSRPALGPTQPPAAFSPVVWSEPPSVEVRNSGPVPLHPSTSSWLVLN